MLATPNEQFAMSTNYLIPKYTSVSNVYGPIPYKCKKGWNKSGCNEAVLGRINPLFGTRQLSHNKISKTIYRTPPKPYGCEKADIQHPLSACKSIKPRKAKYCKQVSIDYQVNQNAKCTLATKEFPDVYSQRGEWTGYTADTRKYLLPVTIIDVLNIDKQMYNRGRVFSSPVNVYENTASTPTPGDEYIPGSTIFIPDATKVVTPVAELTCVNNIVNPSISTDISSNYLKFM